MRIDRSRQEEVHMRLARTTQEQAQTTADAWHARMIAQNREYALAVQRGQITAWAIPYQDGANWYVNAKARILEALTRNEQSSLVAYG